MSQKVDIDAVERCPEDGQTVAWHLTVGGTDYFGVPRTNAAFVSCSWRAGHVDQCSLFDVDEMPSERRCTCGLELITTSEVTAP